ncbi:unnamed protein product [Triticum turgidum subsp. durum]|uniref:Uncharacterized protein n=1 Tax=Triticum turgidum subsp. durum TaxID=4567 RepID=A0A9R0R6S4_TRITD|nr:unnamed protein product [Triticum turgidum subsp. durum]
MAIGAPRDTSNILEDVWATIMTETPTGCTPMPASNSGRGHGTPAVQDRRVMSADVGGAVNRVIELEEIGGEYWDYLFPPVL